MVEATIIEDIQREWLRLASSLAGETARTFLNRVLKLMYIEPGQFILEFLQNAEDARMELGKGDGFFRIELWDDKIIVEHNGKPFSDRDIRDLCATKSSKKPSKGHKGYIGVGWKSVFKVSSRVEVYSNGFAFAFDSRYWHEHAERPGEFSLSPNEVLWQVTPIPIQPAEYVDPRITRFVIHLDDPSYYEATAHTIEELKPSVFLFLEHVNRIEVIDHIGNKRKVIEWFIRPEDKIEGVRVHEMTVNLHENGHTKAEKFIVFKKEFDVPGEVKSDRTTIEAQRGDVMRRDVAIAFALDPATGDLRPLEASQFWGVYSFLPLHEVRSGLSFLIQADFIVHPGRRYINVEAKWNQWLMSCLAEIVKIAIEYLARRFQYSYLRVFGYRDVGDEVYKKLIEPTIISTIKRLLADPKVVCIKGHIVNLSSSVRATDDVLELVRQGLITEEDLKHIYGFEKHILDPKVRLRPIDRIETLDLVKLLKKDFITIKLSEDFNRALELLAKIYKTACRRKLYVPDSERLVVTASKEVKLASDVFLCKLPPNVEELRERLPEVDAYLNALDFVNERLAAALGDEVLKWLGVKEVSLREVCEKTLLPKISAEAFQPRTGELLAITAIVKKSGVLPDRPIWVVAMNGAIKRSNDLYYPLQHFREIDNYVEVFRKINIEFLNISRYIDYDDDEGGWKEFFSSAKVKGFKGCEWVYGYHMHDDYKTIIHNIRKLLEVSSEDDNKQYMRMLKHLYESELSPCWGEPLTMKVITDEGLVMDSTQCLLHDAYNPEEKWAKWKDRGFRLCPFITPGYIEDSGPESISAWREFLMRALGVRSKASSEDVERFALWFAESKLRDMGYTIEGRGGEGYDLIVRRGDETVYVEVKGRKELNDIELSQRETEMAHEYGNRYWLIVVENVSNDPKAYLIRNPSSMQQRIVVPARLIKERGMLL